MGIHLLFSYEKKREKGNGDKLVRQSTSKINHLEKVRMGSGKTIL